MEDLLYGIEPKDEQREKRQLHSTSEKIEKFILVHVEAQRELLRVEDSLNELEELVNTSGGAVCEKVIQNLDKQNTKHYVGKGKIEEIQDLIELHGADGVVCNHELSSVQLRVLNEMLGVRVLDRTQIVLDIFAGRALSREGKLQVELAQLKYSRAHIAGMGISMSRQGGGIGTKGPGEKKIETDRRLIDDRIVDIQRELKTVENERANRRLAHSKNTTPVISLVGYTNAGKSSLLNILSDAGVLSENMLFATLDTTTRKVMLNGGSKVFVVDTVGFIQKLPTTLVQAFKSTLEELTYADVLLHVVDGSSHIRDEQMATVYETLNELGCLDIPIITVYNKCDKEQFIMPTPIDKYATASCIISSKLGTNVDELKDTIESVLKSFRQNIEIVLPYSEGTLLGQIHEKCEIIEEEYKENGTYLNIFCDDKIFNKVLKYKL